MAKKAAVTREDILEQALSEIRGKVIVLIVKTGGCLQLTDAEKRP